jgi:hypothetical protein
MDNLALPDGSVKIEELRDALANAEALAEYTRLNCAMREWGEALNECRRIERELLRLTHGSAKP